MTYPRRDGKQVGNEWPVRSHATSRWLAVAFSATVGVALIFFMSADGGVNDLQDNSEATNGQSDTTPKVPQGKGVMREVVAPSGTHEVSSRIRAFTRQHGRP